MSNAIEVALQRLRDIFEVALPKSAEVTSRLEYSEEIDQLTDAVGSAGIEAIKAEIEARGYSIQFIPRLFLQHDDCSAPHSVFRFKRIL